MRWVDSIGLGLGAVLLCSCPSPDTQTWVSEYIPGLSAYDNAVLDDGPVLYLPLRQVSAQEEDLAGGHEATYRGVGHPAATTLPNGDAAQVFDGATQYLEVTSEADLSVPTSGVLTIEAWMRPDALEFPHDQGSGYVHWLGKGTPDQQEYVARIYSFSNTENPSRPNRISGYAFNLSGGLGSGSYFQDGVTPGQWIHYALVINTRVTSVANPTGYAAIYKNGVLRDTTALNQYNVVPGAGSAPLRIGTRDGGSFFLGAIGKVALYDYELTAVQLTRHVELMKK